MAVINKGNSKNWWISIYRGKGVPRKYIPTGTDDKELAIAMELLAKRALRGNIERDAFISAIDALCGWDSETGTSIDLLWSEYEKAKPTVGKTTLRQRQSMCELFSDWCQEHQLATKYIENINTQQVYAFAEWLMAVRPGSVPAVD